MKDAGRLDEAIESFDRAIALRPDDPASHSNRIYTLYYHSDWTAEKILQEHRRWNQQHAGKLASSAVPHTNDRSPDRPLRIGYISPNFCDHCQALFLTPLLSQHDRKVVEVFCYSDVAVEDTVTQKLRQLAHEWRDTAGLSDERLAELVRSDRIDILVDLSLHMARHRLLVFARKPAPVQVSWLGYPGTTGVAAIDYRLTDPFLDPIGQTDRHYSEESIRLPDTFWCYDPLDEKPLLNDLPAQRNGFVTFSCFNNFCKVNDGVLELWAQVLAAVAGSRLLLLAPSGVRPAKSVGKILAVRHRIKSSGVHRLCRSTKISRILSSRRSGAGHISVQRPHHKSRFAMDGRTCHHAYRSDSGRPGWLEPIVQPGFERIGRT